MALPAESLLKPPASTGGFFIVMPFLGFGSPFGCLHAPLPGGILGAAVTKMGQTIGGVEMKSRNLALTFILASITTILTSGCGVGMAEPDHVEREAVRE